MTANLVLRLAGPLQSWGSSSQFNRRETDMEPTKSGVLGLLAAADGRQRGDSITDLLSLELGVRVDQAGSLLRDYHTVSDYRGVPLLSAAVNAKGVQKGTSPKKLTHVTQRFYLQDAVFVAVIRGDEELIGRLARACTHPAFPLSLGRRSCVPAQPLVLRGDDRPAWAGSMMDVLSAVPWAAGPAAKRRAEKAGRTSVHLAVTYDDRVGSERRPGAPNDDGARTELRSDVPISFGRAERGMTARLVTHDWVEISTGALGRDPGPSTHDPFAFWEA